MVFLSETAMELCNIALGDEVLLTGKSVAVKTAFPCNDGSIVSLSLTKTAIEFEKLGTLIKVQKLDTDPYIAKEVLIELIGKQPIPPLSSEFDVMIRSHNDERIFAIGNIISVPFYGRKLIFKIVKVKFDTDLKLDEEMAEDLSQVFGTMNISENNRTIRLYKTNYTTKWTVLRSIQDDNRKKKRLKFDDIGGYSDLISKIQNLMDDALGVGGQMSQFNPIRGILLYGSPGVGKSTISNTLISEYDLYSVTISVLNLIPKNLGDTEIVLKELFEDAVAKAPSIILLEDIDTLCPKKSSSSTDQERKLLATLINLFDELRYTNSNVAVLATTSKLDFVDNSLRRAGRLQKEFEVSVPDRKIRREIIRKLLLKVPHTLTEKNIKDISSETHGFVAADLEGLCSEARSHAKERLSHQNIRSNLDIVEIMFEDVQYALRNVNPSAMKEALVEIPNVKWSEIGGQEDLKLKLKQAVEWPLKHPEVFQRMGIVPPKGVLMFGPPGCSKTMIAKALATESKLNFLNINGPELFSKWVGDSEKAVRDIFRKARQVAPSIIFIDEIDALGGERASSSKSGGSNVQERVLTQLLTELDGVTALGNVTLVAATNRPDRIDKALLRPGRLDRIIYVPLPDAETRREIFAIKLKKMPIADDIIIQDLVDITEGYSGAEIQAVCHEAAMNALELDLTATQITKDHFRTALSIVKPRTSVSLIKMYDNYIANADMQANRAS
ncbi:ATPase family protein 2 homolog isoform X2 [Belonocnema kinseyi]|nr:ATPase family protein 2 homolog isoform X2 [Belonocnema kinseyi]